MTFFSASIVLLLLAGQAPAPGTQTAPAAAGVIRGHVVGGDTGQPLRNAQVHLGQTESQGGAAPAVRENRTVSTDAEGRYEFRKVPAGRFFISAMKTAYVQTTWGQTQEGVAVKPLELRAGELLERVDITLPRGGVITGRVFDEFGEPLTGISINALRIRTINGTRQLNQAGSGGTNDAGEFRLFGLTAGQYLVQAVWRRIGQGDPTLPDRSGYPATFFPGTLNEAEAQRFTIAAGRTIGDLVMTMTPIRTARVEGTVVDADGRPLGNVFLQVLQQSSNNNFMTGQPVRPDGTFSFATLTPGDYVFRTEPTAARKEVAIGQVTVGSDDITNLRLVALPPAIVSGRVLVDPSTPLPSIGFSLVALIENQRMPGGLQPARIGDDLSFEMTAAPGRNRIGAMNLPPGWTIRSARIKSVDVMDDGFEVKAGEQITGVDVELTNKVTAIAGLVTNARGEPAKDYTLLMFPADSKRWKTGSRYLRTARPDQDGRFRTTGVVPADYYIIAIEKLESGQVYDPEFLERVRSKATNITVGEGETRTVDLKIQS
jgi:protocatechuate 3,4-dioxygenase beta subunit